MRQPFVIARCPSKNRILLGGLGFQCVGQMWFDEAEYHKGYEDYAGAEIVADAPRGPLDDATFAASAALERTMARAKP